MLLHAIAHQPISLSGQARPVSTTSPCQPAPAAPCPVRWRRDSSALFSCLPLLLSTSLSSFSACPPFSFSFSPLASSFSAPATSDNPQAKQPAPRRRRTGATAPVRRQSHHHHHHRPQPVSLVGSENIHVVHQPNFLLQPPTSTSSILAAPTGKSRRVWQILHQSSEHPTNSHSTIVYPFSTTGPITQRLVPASSFVWFRRGRQVLRQQEHLNLQGPRQPARTSSRVSCLVFFSFSLFISSIRDKAATARPSTCRRIFITAIASRRRNHGLARRQ